MVESSTPPAPDAFTEIASEFDFLDNWDDRYRYIIELGRKLPAMRPELKTAAAKVRGCVSQVWLVAEAVTTGHEPLLRFQADSDAQIVRGLVYIALTLFQNQPVDKIIGTDAMAHLSAIGLDKQITPQRSNGLRSMVERVQLLAREALAAT